MSQQVVDLVVNVFGGADDDHSKRREVDNCTITAVDVPGGRRDRLLDYFDELRTIINCRIGTWLGGLPECAASLNSNLLGKHIRFWKY